MGGAAAIVIAVSLGLAQTSSARAQDFFSALFGTFGARPPAPRLIPLPFPNDDRPRYDDRPHYDAPRGRIAYGGDPATFQELVDKGLLDRVMPAGRASDCPDEYQQVAQAFDSTIKPHVDAALMSKVLTMTWLLPDDLQ